MTTKRTAKGQFARVDPRDFLLSRVEKDASGCWNWTGALFHGGYGYFKCISLQKYAMNASRASWIIHNGPISGGLHVCHTCDNRRCVNPEHLFLGTRRDNIDDCVAKGRTSKGADRHNAVLDESKVRLIRSMWQQKIPFREIGVRLGVSHTVCHRVANGSTWAHVA